MAAQAAPKSPHATKSAKGREAGDFLPKFASAFLQFAVVFALISAAFFYVENYDSGNKVLSLFGDGIKSNAYELRQAADRIDVKKNEKQDKIKEVAKYTGKDALKNAAMETIKTIVATRMDWTDILMKLNEVTETVYAKNSLSQYVQYNNFVYNVASGRFNVSGTLSDPLGKNLTKLAELEAALYTYPRDPENPDDKTVPYFYGLQEFNSFTKSFNQTTGRYQSQFTMILSTRPNTK